MPTFTSAEELRAAIGQEIGPSDWLQVAQERIDDFAHATGDLQWIHVDPQRAAQSPFGSTIAHGFLTLSLLPVLTRQYYRVEGASMTVNYGVDRARFVSPVRAGASLRARSTIVEVVDVKNAAQVTLSTTLDIQGEERPALVADTVHRVYFPA